MDKFDRVKRREYMRKYYAKHRDEWNAYQREWYNKNREKKEEQRRKAEKEKLVELLCSNSLHRNGVTMYDVADHLIFNGVTISVRKDNNGRKEID